MNKKIERIFSVLNDIAVEIDRVANARISSCVVYKNDIISVGVNRLKTHPFQALHSRNEESIYWHAETNAIFNALKSGRIGCDGLQRSSLFVCRVDQSYKHCLAKPCEGCMKAIRKFKLKNVYYTSENGLESLELT